MKVKPSWRKLFLVLSFPYTQGSGTPSGELHEILTHQPVSMSLNSDHDQPVRRATDASEPETGPQIKVFIVSEVRLHRDGLASLLRGCSSIQMLGAHGLEDSPLALRATGTDVALLDAMQPAEPGLVGALRQARPRLRILALGIRETASEVLACAAAGIDGYVRIDAALNEMVAAIQGVVRGELICSPHVAASLYRCIAAPSAVGTEPLTVRELQVADLMNRGLPNKEIARQLGVEPCTAKNHVRNILQKLNVHGRGQAVAKLRNLIGERLNAG
jgi:two-component system nitrate/nitrite response regulator NarL